MNDRFRFRAYDETYKRFLYRTLIDSKEASLSWEQCTGLKDKNGKLIYEGDILKPKSNTITKEVVYEDGSFWAKDTLYFHDKCHIFQTWIDECEYEIVGNIHEKESK